MYHLWPASCITGSMKALQRSYSLNSHILQFTVTSETIYSYRVHHPLLSVISVRHYLFFVLSVSCSTSVISHYMV